MFWWRAAVAMGTAVLWACTAGAQQPSVVFQIGRFDRSSLEFGSGSATSPLRYVVGQSSLKDWPASESAMKAGTDVKAEPTRTVAFTLGDQHAHAYRLHMAVLLETASVPELKVTINGRRGLFTLHPQLDYSNGDQGDSFYPAYSRADVVFDVPGAWLRAGENTMTFEAGAGGEQTVPDAALTWDAIALERVDGAEKAATARVEPTVFWTHAAGGLVEDVNVYVPHAAPFSAGDTVELSVNGKRYVQPVRPGAAEFGEALFVFRVPQFAAGSKARVAWRAGGRGRHVEQVVDPAKQWTLYLVPHIHVDVGYSDYQAKVAAIQAESIDEAMQMTTEHPAFRFSLDGEWDLEQYMQTRTPAEQQRALAAIKAQHLFVPAQYANLLTGFPTAETLIRSLYPSADFARVHGTPFNYANLTDVPSYSWSYASVLAAAGIHMLAGGSNNYRAPVLLQGRLNEDSPVWWQGPDGGKVLLWYSRIYQQMQMLFGLPPVLDAGHDTVPLFLQQYARPGYKAHAVLLYGTQQENTDLFPQQAELADSWNQRYAYPHMEYTGFHQALTSIAEQFGDAIPTIRGDGGPYWEDGIAADAKYAAMERETEPRALTAEKLDTLSTFVDPHLAPDATRLDSMWHNMVLMDEHTWGASESVSSPTSEEAVDQLAIKDQYAVRASAQADFLVRTSMANLARSMGGGAGTLVVWNTLNWRRSGLVELDLPDGWQVVDAATKQPLGLEVVRAGDGFRRVRFMAADVPPMGYRRYEEARAKGDAKAAEAQHTTTMENAYYRVVLDPAAGAIDSIFDKKLGRELVNAKSPYRFAQYLYVTGGDKGPNTLLQYSHVAPAPQLTVHAATGGRLLNLQRTAYGMVARMESSSVNTPSLVTEVRLFDSEKKIEIVEDLHKKSVTTKEGVYFAFPFAMQQPRFQYEVQNGVVNPATDMYPGAGHEWFSVQHWAAVEQGGIAAAVMPLDASLVTLGDINRGKWPESFGQRPGTIFSYVMNNYWDTNYRAAQGGEFRFHYVVTSAAATDPVALSRLGWEEATPLEVDRMTTQDRAVPAPESTGIVPQSFVEAGGPALLFETWKQAEDGRGTILRFLDLGGAPRQVTVRLPSLRLATAWRTNAVEKDQEQLQIANGDSVRLSVHPHEIVSLRVVTR